MTILISAVELGSILCKHCGALIDTLDTEKVITYYSECHQGECKNKQAAEQDGKRMED